MTLRTMANFWLSFDTLASRRSNSSIDVSAELFFGTLRCMRQHADHLES